jgi:flagellar biosynthesis protein FlhF
MNDNVRIFRAATIEDALAQVRREMGVEAVVVETRNVASRGMFAWLSSQQEVEVIASRPVTASEKPAESKGKSANINRLAVTQERSVVPSIQGTVAAAAVAARNAKSVTNEETFEGRVVNGSRSAVRPSVTTAPVVPSVPPDRSHTSEPAARNRIAELDSSREPSRFDFARTPPPEITTNAAAPSSSIEVRLDALQQMIADLGKRTRTSGLVEIPPELFANYLTLIEADVDEELARELIRKLQRHSTAGQLANTAATTPLLAALIEREIPCVEPLTPQIGRRQIAMVVGPTGVGKTTTLAKLAGRFGLQPGLKLGLITVDTYRVAAVEQLRTYAEIIDLPMKVVTNAEEMPEALDSFADRDLVLIDTAGRSPHDERKLSDLEQLILAACPDHVYLVMSLASGARAMRAMAERFAVARPTSLVVTKLDEADGCGGLLAASRNTGLPIAYFTTGQEVPRDIEPANPCRAAQLILGLDQLHRTPHHEPLPSPARGFANRD